MGADIRHSSMQSYRATLNRCHPSLEIIQPNSVPLASAGVKGDQLASLQHVGRQPISSRLSIGSQESISVTVQSVNKAVAGSVHENLGVSFSCPAE